MVSLGNVEDVDLYFYIYEGRSQKSFNLSYRVLEN